MITNFEHITRDLSADERALLPVIIAGLRAHVGPDQAIKGPEICRKMNERGTPLTEARLRKMVNLIRSHGVLPVIATSRGYYVTNDLAEINKQIRSLEDRRDAIQSAIDGLRGMIKVKPIPTIQ